MAEDTAQRVSEKTTSRFLGRENHPIINLKPIGQGTYSIVHFGQYERETRNSVAIKVATGYHPEYHPVGDEKVREAFELENKVLRALEQNGSKHTPIVHNYHEGALPFDRPYIVMDLAQGKCLDDFTYVDVERNVSRVDERTALEIARQLAETLEAAHRAGYAYADWKFLSNLFWDPDRKHLTVVDWNGVRDLTEKERLMNVYKVSTVIRDLLGLTGSHNLDKSDPKWSKLSSSTKDILMKGQEAKGSETYTDLETLKTDLGDALAVLGT